MTRWPLALVTVVLLTGALAQPRSARPDAPQGAPALRGIRLEDLTWVEAEKILTPDTVVVIPVGAAAKEHGPHLKLNNDLTLAEYLTRRVLDRASIVVAPTLTYHFYPSFLEYPGSTSLTLETARDMTVDIVRTLAAYGPRRFYALNTGVSTVRALKPAADILAGEGILFRYTDLSVVLGPIERQVSQQPGGSHADEIETSMLLYIDPASVDMTKAAKDYDARGQGPLSRTRGKPNTTYSPTGIFGDATLATSEKGRSVVEAFVPALVQAIEETRVASLPLARVPRSPGAAPAAAPASGGPGTGAAMLPLLGTAQDERAIRELGLEFETAWRNLDSWGVASLWTEDGDVVHADGFAERSRQEILEQRATMFMRREYRTSRHRLSMGTIKFIAPGLAVVNGQWDLDGLMDANRKMIPAVGGPCTLVLKKTADEGWRILAFRYARHTRGDPSPPTRLVLPE